MPRDLDAVLDGMSLENISLTIGAKVPTAIYTSSAEPVCIVDTMGERKDDADVARRIKACWNACRFIPTANLEAMAARDDAHQATKEPR